MRDQSPDKTINAPHRVVFFIGLLQATVPFIQGSSSEEDQALMPGARVSISVAAAIIRKRISGPGLSGDAKSVTVFEVGSIANRFPTGAVPADLLFCKAIDNTRWLRKAL